MISQNADRPSIAEAFFHRITSDDDPAAAIKRLVGASPPTDETEWLEFKGGSIKPEGAQTIWSKALSGFANTQGGVLIWGLDARKNAAGINEVGSVLPVKNCFAFASRLAELHHQATEPPVLGVEIKPYPMEAGSDEGFVVCFIPESRFRPHRAEHSERQYYIRAGDDFVVPSVSLLRNLFFPQSRCVLIPTFRARCIQSRGIRTTAITEYHIDGYVKNEGSATAFNTFIVIASEPPGVSFSVDGWHPVQAFANNCCRETKNSIHPGFERWFYSTGYMPGVAPKFRIRIFAQDAEPTEWLVAFTESEMAANAEKKCERVESRVSSKVT